VTSAELAAATPIDGGPGATYVLAGRIVTMGRDREVVDDGQLVVDQGRIAAVLPASEPLPERFAEAPRYDTRGTIYPGLVDLHNHFVYDVLPLWTVPRLYRNRTQWPRADGYAGTVTLPVRALAEVPGTARALVRYVEAKALVGGTTTGQGMRTRVHGGARLFRGAMRNLEETGDPLLPEAGTRVPNLFVNEEGVREFRARLGALAAYMYHLAEGVDEAARRTFTDLADNDLLAGSLVGIHCLGLQPADLAALGAAGAKAVWSPFSNLLLYGQTVDVGALVESGVPFAIGCDWSPTGSKNLLQELKVARWAARAQGAEMSDADLVHAVTAGAAAVVGWEQAVGSLVPGAYADLLVVAGGDGDPYGALVDATERDVRLVVVHGVARYGDRRLMGQLHGDADPPLEDVDVAGTAKAFQLHAEGSELNDLGWAAATAQLQEAMADLPGFRDAAQEQATLAGDEEPSFVVELDNEWVPTPDDLQDLGLTEAALAADWSELVDSLPLDPPEVGADDYWERVRSQPNLDDDLKAALEASYG
jgi:5-methylthioadenosine/S-adenosylhomocysteine deaminase